MADDSPPAPTCSSLMCIQAGKFRCTRCREATPPTVYCSEKCQKFDWMFHKAYCGKYAYTFDLTLVGSTDPVIKRTFDVPSWFTFEMLHYTVQYGMGPWQCSHLHQFAFEKPRPRTAAAARSMIDPTGEPILNILPKALYEDEQEMEGFRMPGFPARKKVPTELEEELKLSDVYEPEGRLYALVAPDPKKGVYPLMYTYDLGDFWEHKLIFKGKKLARAARPLFSLAEGCGPVEDCGGPEGWNRVKAAFRAPLSSRTREQKELVEWAKWASALEESFDPLKDPNVTQMNYEGRWENHLNGFRGDGSASE